MGKNSDDLYPMDYDEETAKHLDEDYELTKPCCDSPSKEKCEQCQEIGLANPLNH